MPNSMCILFLLSHQNASRLRVFLRDFQGLPPIHSSYRTQYIRRRVMYLAPEPQQKPEPPPPPPHQQKPLQPLLPSNISLETRSIFLSRKILFFFYWKIAGNESLSPASSRHLIKAFSLNLSRTSILPNSSITGSGLEQKITSFFSFAQTVNPLVFPL
jgi:hypothetical protein